MTRLVATRSQQQGTDKNANKAIHNPLTKTGKKVMKSMKKFYGAKRGPTVFYAMAHKKGKKWHK